MNKNKHPVESTGDIHLDAFNAAQDSQNTARRRGTRLQRAGATLGLLTTLGTGAALVTHQPKAEVAGIAAAGYVAAGAVEAAKKGQQQKVEDAGLTADAAAANRIIAAKLHGEWPPLWATGHTRQANFREAMSEDNLSRARTIEHGGMILSSDGTITPVDARGPASIPQAVHSKSRA